jgi:plasmid rolling circle replication initiator protein Rep
MLSYQTLALKSCKASQLHQYIKSMQNTLKKIVEKYRKRYQRGTGLKLEGVRSLECNFNANKKWYNPHFHLIVKEKWMAEVIPNLFIVFKNLSFVQIPKSADKFPQVRF